MRGFISLLHKDHSCNGPMAAARRKGGDMSSPPKRTKLRGAGFGGDGARPGRGAGAGAGGGVGGVHTHAEPGGAPNGAAGAGAGRGGAPSAVPVPWEVESDEDAQRAAAAAFAWLIAPMDIDEFFASYFEQRPLLVTREERRDYFDGLLGKSDVEAMAADDSLVYGQQVDVTRYRDGERTTLNGEGAARAADLWKHFDEGCSLRLLCPQEKMDRLHSLMSRLEEHWRSFAGCNAYLTPAGTQGFAPHYDDIEAFVLQTEGAKQWAVYEPRSPDEVLPRYSSGNFSQDEIGEPVLTCTLRPGDLLYFPRGFIHQAKSVDDTHSLHLTISTGLHSTWYDLLAVELPRRLTTLAAHDPEFRESLPRDYGDCLGIVHCDLDSDYDFSLEAATRVVNQGLETTVRDFVEVAKADAAADVGEGGAGRGAGGDGAGGAAANGAPDEREELIRAQVEAAAAGARRQFTACQRTVYQAKLIELCSRVVQLVSGDVGADDMMRRFVRDRLPPVPTKAEETDVAETKRIVAETSAGVLPEEFGGLTPSSLVRIARPGIARIVQEDDCAALYHCMANSRVHHAAEEQVLRFSPDTAPALSLLLSSYPAYLMISDLPIAEFDSEDDDEAAAAEEARMLQQLEIVAALVDAKVVTVMRGST